MRAPGRATEGLLQGAFPRARFGCKSMAILDNQPRVMMRCVMLSVSGRKILSMKHFARKPRISSPNLPASSSSEADLAERGKGCAQGLTCVMTAYLALETLVQREASAVQRARQL